MIFVILTHKKYKFLKHHGTRKNKISIYDEKKKHSLQFSHDKFKKTYETTVQRLDGIEKRNAPHHTEMNL